MTVAHDIIIRPIVTEHSMEMIQDRKYTFEVKRTANKYQIKDAVEKIFGVAVERITTMNMQGKMKRMGAKQGRRSAWKKATVKLTPNSKTIDFFEGIV